MGPRQVIAPIARNSFSAAVYIESRYITRGVVRCPKGSNQSSIDPKPVFAYSGRSLKATSVFMSDTSCPTCRAFERDLRALAAGIDRLLARFSDHAKAAPVSAGEAASRIAADPVCDQALIIVHQEYADSKLSLRAVSARLRVHETSLGHLFRQQTGHSFRRYLRDIRIRHAAELLASSRDGVKTISGMVGYNDLSHFARYFHDVTGYTPAEYRKQQSGHA